MGDGNRDVDDFARLHASECGSQLVRDAFEQPELKSGCDDYDDADAAKRAPTFFLHRTDLETGEAPTKQPRQVLIEENAPHAIFATNARLASSRNANTCSRLTPG